MLWLVLSIKALGRLLAATELWPDAQVQPSFFQIIWHLFDIARIQVSENVVEKSTAAGAGSIMMFLTIFPIITGTGFQALRQVFCIAAGLTPNELIVRKKYDYLKNKELIFYNPFDVGPIQNCLTYWSTLRPDWYSMYSERTDLNPEEALPYFAFSRILRAWDKSRVALEKVRIRKQKQREELLLRQFGGVTKAEA